MDRRRFLKGAAAASAVTVTGCSASMPEIQVPVVRQAGFFSAIRDYRIRREPTFEFIRDYEERTDGDFRLPAIPVDKIDKRFLRQRVSFPSTYKSGTVVVDVAQRHLYLVEPGGTAVRYGVGVGKQGFEWQGNAVVGAKREWPRWTPPAPMIQRKPHLEKYSAANGGMDPGLDNPLGARALYLFQNGRDTLYRLHGTPEWDSIGTAASSGCIRLMNQDIIDLYNRVPLRAKVIVLQESPVA